MRRRLTVRKETLADLTPEFLAAVGGGHDLSTTVVRTGQCPTTPFFTGIYPSINVDCTSVLDAIAVGTRHACTGG